MAKQKYAFECETFVAREDGKRVSGNVKYIVRCIVGGIICDADSNRACVLLHVYDGAARVKIGRDFYSLNKNGNPAVLTVESSSNGLYRSVAVRYLGDA